MTTNVRFSFYQKCSFSDIEQIMNYLAHRGLHENGRVFSLDRISSITNGTLIFTAFQDTNPIGNIEIFEMPGRVEIEIVELDDQHPVEAKTDDLLADIYEQLKQAVHGLLSTWKPAKHDSGAEPKPHWFPRTEKTLKKWQLGYGVVKGLREYDDLYGSGQKPRITDFVVRINEFFGEYTWGLDTVQRIVSSGTKGWLDDVETIPRNTTFDELKKQA